MQTKICTKCHIEKELAEFHKKANSLYGVRAVCRICYNQYRNQYNHDNQVSKKHYERHKQYYQDKRDANRESANAYFKEYYQTHKEEHKLAMQQWRLKNKEHEKEMQKLYNKTDKGKAVRKTIDSNRRIAKKSGSFIPDDILNLYRLQSGKCVYCKYCIENNNYHVDHIMPLSKGGTNELKNIQLLCPQCNLSKNDKLPEDFAQKFGQLL